MITKGAEAQELSNLISHNKIILLKTDTIYGLLGNCNDVCVEKIKVIKNRTKNGFGLFFDSIEMIKKYADLNNDQESILYNYLPGFFTFILPIKEEKLDTLPLQSLVYNEQIKKYTIGCRIPNLSLCREIVSCLKKPIIATSANISNNPTPIVFADIDNQITSKVDFVFRYENDDSQQNLESTIVDIAILENIKILRQGSGIFI